MYCSPGPVKVPVENSQDNHCCQNPWRPSSLYHLDPYRINTTERLLKFSLMLLTVLEPKRLVQEQTKVLHFAVWPFLVQMSTS